jgi:hypothetical protein
MHLTYSYGLPLVFCLVIFILDIYLHNPGTREPCMALISYIESVDRGSIFTFQGMDIIIEHHKI